jgi:type IX secretion system PorP/SprF family membrane protein
MSIFFKYIRKLVPLIVCFAVMKTNCQDIHYSNLHENLYQLNPSTITNIKNSLLQFTYRNQWPGNADFVTYSAAFLIRYEEIKSTAGIQVYRDDQGKGIISTTSVNLLYGYHTQLFTGLSFAAGISGGYNIFVIDYSKLHFENNTTPTINTGKNYADFSTGIEFGILKRTFLGFSISNLLTPEISPGNRLYRKYCLSYHGVYNLSNQYSHDHFELEPILVTTVQNNFNEILYGARCNYLSFQGGVYLRQDYKFNFDATIILLGISFGNNDFIYTYDINLSAAESNFNKMASHEVTFLHKFEYTNTRKKKGAIKCPKF